MSERNDKELKDWLLKRSFNITASKMAAIVKEYSNDPYWSTINIYGDAFAIYAESKMSKDQLYQRSKDSSQHYTRFGNYVEDFTFTEFLKILDLETSLTSDNIIYNVHQDYEGEEKIACTPDYIVKGFSPFLLDVFNRLDNLNELRNFFFVKHPDFKVDGTAFLLECKAKGYNQVKKDYKVDENGNLVPADSIILQLQTQLLVTGVKWGVIGTLMFTDEGLKLHFYFVNADKKIQQIIRDSVNRYFDEIEKGDIPVPTDRWDKSLDYVTFPPVEPLELFEKPKDRVLTGEDFQGKKDTVKKLLDKIEELQKILEEKKKSEDVITYIGAVDKLKTQRVNLDKYLQMRTSTKEPYCLSINLDDEQYKVLVEKENDWVSNRERVIRVGEVLKKGARTLTVTKKADTGEKVVDS